jgi:hypothetical protein
MHPVSNFSASVSVSAERTIYKSSIMKKLGIFILLSTILAQAFSQEINATEESRKERRSERSHDNSEVVVGRNFLRITENDSMVNIRVGNRGLKILESLEGDGTRIKVEKYNDAEQDHNEADRDRNYDYNNDERPHRSGFRGNWSGVELGLNNYTTSRSSQVIPDPIDYMTLHSGKSVNFNVNFAQLNLGITRHVGFVTGVGFTWNNYRFDGNNNIVKGDNGMIVMLDPGEGLEKSKLTTLYMHIPFLFEFQIPVSRNHLSIATGPIGAVKLASHSKMLFEDKHKVKSNSDFNLNMLRYGATVRAGYSNFNLYGTYYLTPLFRSGDGPDGYNLYPFEVGIAFTFNN